jgi:hypothetical protein
MQLSSRSLTPYFAATFCAIFCHCFNSKFADSEHNKAQLISPPRYDSDALDHIAQQIPLGALDGYSNVGRKKNDSSLEKLQHGNKENTPMV